MKNIKATEEFILEMCQIFSEEEKKCFEWESEKRIYSAEEMFLAKFGYLNLAQDKETSLKKAKEIIHKIFYSTESKGEAMYFVYGAKERDLDKFLPLFEYDNVKDLFLEKNDIFYEFMKSLTN